MVPPAVFVMLPAERLQTDSSKKPSSAKKGAAKREADCFVSSQHLCFWRVIYRFFMILRIFLFSRNVNPRKTASVSTPNRIRLNKTESIGRSILVR